MKAKSFWGVAVLAAAVGCGDPSLDEYEEEGLAENELITSEIPTTLTFEGAASIAMSADGSKMAVGDPRALCKVGDASVYGGAVWMYEKVNGRWVDKGGLLGAQCIAGGRFGISVAMSADGSKVVVGAPGAPDEARVGKQPESGSPYLQSYNVPGAVYTYARRSGDRTWFFRERFTGAGLGAGAQFGEAVSLSSSGGWLAVGAPDRGPKGKGKGSVRLYSSNMLAGTPLARQWNEAGSVVLAGGESQDGFGAAVALSGDGATLVVASPRMASNVRVYRKIKGAWTEASRWGAAPYSASDGSSRIDVAVSKTGAVVAVSEDLTRVSELRCIGDWGCGRPRAGGASIYRRVADAWSLDHQQILDEHAGPLALSGDGTVLAFGAPAAPCSGVRSVALGVPGLPVLNAPALCGSVMVLRYSLLGWDDELFASGTSMQGLGEAVAVTQDGSEVTFVNPGARRISVGR